MEKNVLARGLKRRMIVIAILLLITLFYIYGTHECQLVKHDYYIERILNTFTGLTLLIGVAYLCYPKKHVLKTDEMIRPISSFLNKYKLESEMETTTPQYFKSEMEAWNTLRKQLKVNCFEYAVLYIYENGELAIVNAETPAKGKRINYWKPVCMGQISKDFCEN